MPKKKKGGKCEGTAVGYPNEKWRLNYTKSTKDLISMKKEEEKVRSTVTNKKANQHGDG